MHNSHPFLFPGGFCFGLGALLHRVFALGNMAGRLPVGETRDHLLECAVFCGERHEGEEGGREGKTGG